MNSEIYSLLISSCPKSSEEIRSKLSQNGLDVRLLDDTNNLNRFIDETEEELSCILLDLSIQTEDDLERFLRKNKKSDHLKYVPVVGLIKANSPETQPSRNLFFHLLEEPFRPDALKHTIESAQTDFKRFKALLSEVNSRNSAIGLINSGKFRLQTMEQAEALTTMLSLACPEPSVIALGLSELLVNAIEHGNLGISYEEKTKLMEQGKWDEEVRSRLSQDEYKNRFVEIKFSRNAQEINIKVTDQGNGFDWRPFISEELVINDAKHGRGIALAMAMGFDRLSYNEKGNEVTAIVECG